jgi:hypothetical protein
VIAKIAGFLVLSLGGILATGALIFFWEAVAALLERIRFGSGLMFADAEVLLLLAVLLGLAGSGALWLGLRLLGLLRARPSD